MNNGKDLRITKDLSVFISNESTFDYELFSGAYSDEDDLLNTAREELADICKNDDKFAMVMLEDYDVDLSDFDKEVHELYYWVEDDILPNLDAESLVHWLMFRISEITCV